MSAAAITLVSPRVFEVTVRRAEYVSPHVRRITLGGATLDQFGAPQPTLDLRIKILIPTPGHRLSLPGAPDGQLPHRWYQQWLRTEQPGRGAIRSYTVRTLRKTADGPELDVDFVIHSDPRGRGGPGPGSDWARSLDPGARAVFIGPDARASPCAKAQSKAGIRWNPGGAQHVLLAGDETAVPAISAILEALPGSVTGDAFLGVPDANDFQDIRSESSIRITWLARNSHAAPHGEPLQRALRTALMAHGRRTLLDPTESNEHSPIYAWIAGEAGMVKELRRYLVRDAGTAPNRSSSGPTGASAEQVQGPTE